ncbi:hypothetical protein ACJU26_09715 [Acidithiobacillus sp. M4-SHS-6]|uniref:hypothetical protein n=1 Tax=Acidithiobacillus sp. M4-SHS-6 TaxID=3383024 RepID=UPI0039BE4516
MPLHTENTRSPVGDDYFIPVAEKILKHPDCGNREYWAYQFIEPLRQVYAWEITAVVMGLVPRKWNSFHNSLLSAQCGWLMVMGNPGIVSLSDLLSHWLAGLFVYYGWDATKTPTERAKLACKALYAFRDRVVAIAPEQRKHALSEAFTQAHTAIGESPCIDDGESLRMYLTETDKPVSLSLRNTLDRLEKDGASTDSWKQERESLP